VTLDLTQRWQVIGGDSIEEIAWIPDASVDAIVTDPPYFGVKSDSWDNQWEDVSAFLRWLGDHADEWRRVLKPNGSLFVFASPALAAMVEVEVIRPRFNVLNSIRWVKEQGWHRKTEREALRSFLTPWEAVIFAEQFGDAYGDAETALHKRVYAPIGRRIALRRQAAGLERHEVDTACSPSRKPTGLCYRWEEGACLPTLEQWVLFSRLVGDPREYEELRREYEELRREYEELRRPFMLTSDDEAGDIWRFKTVAGYVGKHPCEKPIALMSHIIRASCRPNSVILDPFCGSGSTGVAAIQEGHRFVGVESLPAYVAIARRRIADAAAQGSLFDAGAA
jgi:adenine-specific DNA-methyltransferase